MIITFETFIKEEYHVSLNNYSDVDFYDMSDNYQDLSHNMTRELLMKINDGDKIVFKVINNIQYKNALVEFTKYGEFFRFPSKIIYGWKDLITENVFKLASLTEIHGHTQHFPFDEFYDVFDYGDDGTERSGEFSKWCKMKFKETGDDDYNRDYDFNACYEFLEEVKNIDDVTPQFSNGHHVLSDYATEPLENLCVELDIVKSPEEIIVVINKILDVTHQRSDIAELFIKGGSDSLDIISN